MIWAAGRVTEGVRGVRGLSVFSLRSARVPERIRYDGLLMGDRRWGRVHMCG